MKKQPKLGDIKHLKKRNIHGHIFKKYEQVTIVNLRTGKKKKIKKWVGYF
jgi:hypothetical protein